jgi:serine/threonine-protein kinase
VFGKKKRKSKKSASGNGTSPAAFGEAGPSGDATGDVAPGPEARDEASGSRIGRYTLLEPLGQGGMGTVYRAHDPVIGRHVAIKLITIRPDLDQEEARQYRERFLREAQAAGALVHPSIVAVHDIGMDPATMSPYIVMEHVPGQDLKKVIRSQAPLPSDEAIRIVMQVAAALDYAHRRGIVHRDIKPANVLLSEGGQVKITDFGVARLPGSDLTRSDQFVGSPGFMSPEQLKGAAVDGRSDLFALGVILYQLLTGKSPFDGDTVSEVLYKISTQPVDPPSEVLADVSPDFDPILEKALRKEPVVRFQTGREMIDALMAVAGPDVVAPAMPEDQAVATGGGETGRGRGPEARDEEETEPRAVSSARSRDSSTSPWWTLNSQWRLGVLVVALTLALVGVNWGIHVLFRGPLARVASDEPQTFGPTGGMPRGGPRGSAAVVGTPAALSLTGSTGPIAAVCAISYADPRQMARILSTPRRLGSATGSPGDRSAARLRLELSHQLSSGRIIVRVDGRTVLSRPFDAPKGKKSGTVTHLLSVPSGKHGVEVRILDARGATEGKSRIAGNLSHDRVAVLKAEQRSSNRKPLTLEWSSERD